MKVIQSSLGSGDRRPGYEVGSRISPETAKAVAVLFESEASSLFGYACAVPGVSPSDASHARFIQSAASRHHLR
jgi:hypothetical protein